MGCVAYSRGHKIYFDQKDEEWKYADDHTPADDSRPCKKCGEYPTEEGHDSCLGHLEDVKYACCGHGVVGHAYVLLDDGTRIPEAGGKDFERKQREFDEWYANYLKEHGGR